jgi:uncharacterized membrane protein
MTQKFHLHKSRLETLVDGIFAIAMTILVLEVKVPGISDKHSAIELLHALAHDGVVILAYFASFAFLAIFWVWHHKLTEKIKEIDLPLLMCSLTFLALVCFFPFAAAMFGRYPLNLTANIVYVMLLGMILASQTFMFWLAIRRHQILDTVTAAQALAGHRGNMLGCAIFLVALSPTGFRINIYTGISCIVAGLIVFWLIRKKPLSPKK